MADETTSQYYTIVSSEDTCNVGDTIYINKRTDVNSVTVLNENSPFYFFEDGILIETISLLAFTTFGYAYTPSSSGVHEVFMAQDWGTGDEYTNSNILTITVTDTNVGLVINNKTVQDLSINGKTVQSIKDLSTDKIIYTKTDDVPIEDVLYDKIRHVFIIEDGSDAIVEGQEYLFGDDDYYYDDSVTLDTVEENINEFEEFNNLYIYYDGMGGIGSIEEFYQGYGYLSDDDYYYDYGGLYYNGYDSSLDALIFTQVLSETGGVLWFLIDSDYVCLDCSISNDDSNQVTVFTWTIPTSINPSFSFSNEGYVIGSDLDPNYDYIIVQRDEVIIDLINSDILETNNAFSLYDVEIYYCNSSETQEIIDGYINSGESFKDFAETVTDVLFYYGSLKDMIRVDNVFETSINITLHDFYTTGNYTCNVFDSNSTGKARYGNDRIHTDPFSFQTSVLTFPVTIYLFDNKMSLLQTKTVEFENNNYYPK